MVNSQLEKSALHLFRRNRVMRVTDIAKLLSCSIATVRKRLRVWHSYTSYNRNSSYYTLPDVPRFDSDGLWKYKGVCFSRAGNLTRTILHLVQSSALGLDSQQLGQRLGLMPRSFISYARRIPGMIREKVQGRWVFFHADHRRYLQQKHAREEESRRTVENLPADVEAIQILVDWIKHPGSSLEECARRVQRGGTPVSVEMIRTLLAHHGIEKKTPASPSRAP